MSNHAGHVAELECCPVLEEHECCDRLDFKYTLTHRPRVAMANERRVVPVDVTIHVRIERCPGPFTLGDLVYTTTLLPGEKVRLVTTDRHSRFVLDKETNVSYRHSQVSEEHYFMTAMARELSDLTIKETGERTAHDWGTWGAEADSSYITVGLAGGGQGSIEGEYDDNSTRSFTNSLSRHAESSFFRAEMATRTASSVSVGEVSTRSHTEGESEDHLESATRVFSNPNHCHALSFFFYRITRVQHVKFTLVAIERQVADPAAPTRVASNPLPLPTGVSVMPADVQATAADRPEVEARARESALATALARDGTRAAELVGAARLAVVAAAKGAEPIPAAVRAKALEEVDEGLVAAGFLEAVGGEVSKQAVERLSWERESCLPTGGIIVKGCMDECDICEPEVHRQIELDLARKELENEMLEKQIELLEKSHEYRCCPEGETESPES